MQLCEVLAFCPKVWLLLPSHDFLLHDLLVNVYNANGGKEPNLITSTDTDWLFWRAGE